MKETTRELLEDKIERLLIKLASRDWGTYEITMIENQIEAIRDQLKHK